MATRISETLGVTREALSKQGSFDGFIDIDAPFHVDPHLLRSTRTPELQGARARFEKYFRTIIKLLEASTDPNDRFFRETIKLLQFKELRRLTIHLGYSRSAQAGSGIGPLLAEAIALTARELVHKGVREPELFELVGLFEEGVGADRISDMTVRIILPDLLAYSQRVATNLKMRTTEVTFAKTTYSLPTDGNDTKPIVLVPTDILRDLPIAFDWQDIDRVCAYNAALRQRVNALIGRTWKQAVRKRRKSEIKDAILRYPDALLDLIQLYTKKVGKEYDFNRDPEGLLSWSDIADNCVKQNPLSLAQVRLDSPDKVFKCVCRICDQYATLIEDNGLNELLYDKGKLRHERFAQLLFYGISDAYCRANNLDLSREPNGGHGPVDFKISRGYNVRVTVEVKYSSNPALSHGFEKQLPDYNRAEKTSFSIYLILQTTQSSRAIQSVKMAAATGVKKAQRVPHVIVVDARRKPSASKRQ
jgi:hypothetical protein